jgi:hypothetical protein
LLVQKPWVKSGLLFLVSFAIIFGPAFTLFLTYDFKAEDCPDIWDYLALSDGDFTGSPVRKYRVLIPFLAKGLHAVFGLGFTLMAPADFAGIDFSLGFSFLLVNSAIMALSGVLLFKLLQFLKLGDLLSLIGVLVALTSRWTAYLAGLPMVDSLYYLVLVATLYGLMTKNSKWLLFSILIGPWAKESFIFIAPLIFFFSDIPKGRQVIFFLGSGVLVFGARYGIDVLSGSSATEGISRDLAHFDQIAYSLGRLFSFHGTYEAFSALGVWNLVFASLFFNRVRTVLAKEVPLCCWLFLGIVMIHVVLSGELARMFYLATPVLAIVAALSLRELNIEGLLKSGNE